jgi:hypothetical protein
VRSFKHSASIGLSNRLRTQQARRIDTLAHIGASDGALDERGDRMRDQSLVIGLFLLPETFKRSIDA